MKKIIYLLVGIILFGGLYYSCVPEELPGSIYGTVVDKATGEPIKSAGVTLTPNGSTTVTGSDGHFEFTDLTHGGYAVVITKTGYQDTTRMITVKSGETTPIDIQLEKLPPALKVVDDNRKEIDTLDFGSAEDDVARSFSLFNDGTESLEWQITVTADWIKSVSKIEGVLSAGATQSLIVTIDRTKLNSGENTTTAHITSNNGSKQLTITATNSTVLATLNTLAATNVKTTTATLNGEILTDGSPKYSERGFVYSESSMPTLGSCIQKITSTLTDSKTYSATVAGLTKGKTYYVRAYAINAGKEAYSTNEISFTPSDVLPQVSTQAVTNISRTTSKAIFNGTIIDEGEPNYTERGFVYATTHNPMVDSDTKVVATGKGTGEFSANASNLQVGQTYYVRAYATNTRGTAYGEEVIADFKAITPKVSTSEVKDILRSTGTATFVGTIIEGGDPIYTEHGFVYSTLHNPTLENDTNVIAAGKGKGEFTTNVTNLQLGSIYYVRAYAKNEYVTVYGEEVVADFRAVLPKVTTGQVENLTETTALFNATINSVGDPAYTQCGFVYGSMSIPTLDNGATNIEVNISGAGAIQTIGKNLVANNTYYVRAYAISVGGTIYGESVAFIAKDPRYTILSEVGLMVDNEDLGKANWETAILMCKNSQKAGYTDWYLPSISELTIVKTYANIIGGFYASYYWSNTEYNDDTRYAWCKHFYKVNQEAYLKSYLHLVRCVRKEN